MIRGIVTTFDSISLVNAEVQVKSTKEIVYTDSLGRFSVSVNPDDRLEVNAKGFHKQRVDLEENTKFAAINLKLKPGEKNRKYAIGYGHVTDEDKLSALASINNNDIDFSNYNNMYDIIKNRFSGVQIVNGEIIIRGPSSLRGSNAALILLDGVIVDESVLSNIPPAQVKNINIIKDSGAAIYGSRGANGVVLIETKRGDDN